MRRAIACLVLLLGCSDPPPPEPTPALSATQDGIRVRVGGREVVVHCALACPAAETELTRLSNDCLSNPGSGPHRVATGGGLLTLGCCQEASVAYDRACAEAMPACAQRWAVQCEGMQPPERRIDDSDRGIAPGRGL